MTHSRRRGLWTVAALGLGIVLAGPAQAGAEMEHGGITLGKYNGMDLSIYGQVNRFYRYVNDGKRSDGQSLDNGASQTRLGFRGSSGDKDAPMAWGVRYELGITSNLSQDVGLEQSGNDSTSPFEIRYADIWYRTQGFKLLWGQGDGAARWTDRADTSNTKLAQNHDSRRVGGVQLRDDVGSMFSSMDLGYVFHPYEGTRDDRVRIDSPSYGGFRASASYGGNDEQEYALTWWHLIDEVEASIEDSLDSSSSSSYGHIKPVVKARIGLTRNLNQVSPLPDVTTQYAASVSGKAGNGLNATVAYGHQKPTNFDANSGYYTKLGWDLGNFAVSTDYGHVTSVEDLDFPGEKVDGTHYGVGAQAAFNHYDLYGGWESYSVDRKVAGQPDPKDAYTIFVGGRAKF